MKTRTRAGHIRAFDGTSDALIRLQRDVEAICDTGGIPLRLIINNIDGDMWRCEVDCLESPDEWPQKAIEPLFQFRRRRYARTGAFNVAMLIPTGIDCAIGGHAGDATPAARLIASVCDNLIIHPNVVNASDINEQPSNSMYVEGSLICRLLMGNIALRKVRGNRILIVTEARENEEWIVDQVVNATSAARATLGVNCPKVLVLRRGLSMRIGSSASGRAIGEIDDLTHLFTLLQSERPNYDAVGLSTKLTPPVDTRVIYEEYFGGQAANPWGGAEAALTHAISSSLNVPSAHAPTLENLELRTATFGHVEPRKAAEAISTSFMFCLLKGLHQAPLVLVNADGRYDPSLISAEDVSCLVIPDGCIGLPTLAALLQEIDVIAVRNNTSLMQNDLRRLPFSEGQLWVVESYFEATGLLMALRKGINPRSIARPLHNTRVELV